MTDDQQYWFDIFAKWESSRQVQKQFCLEQQLSYKQFCKWRHRLIAQRLVEASPTAPVNRRSMSRSSEKRLDFMPVSLKSGESQTVDVPPGLKGSVFEIELQLPVGIKLHIRSGS